MNKGIDIVRLSTGNLAILVQEDSIADFTALVNRACNCWPDAPAEIKAFADMLYHGRVLQDYKAQEHSKPRSE